MFCFYGRKACEILALWPGIEPTSPALKGEVLTTRQPEKSLISVIVLFITVCLFCSSSMSLLNISCIFSIHASLLFLRSSFIFTVITLNAFSDRLQMQGLPSRLQGFNPQFVQVQGRDFCSFSLVAQPLELSCAFGPTSACGPPSGICSLPRREGPKSNWLGHTYLLRLGKDKAATTRACAKCLWRQRLEGSCNSLWCACSGGSPSQCPQRQGLACGERVRDVGSAPCTPLNNGASFPRQTMLPLGAFPAMELLTPVPGAPHSHPLRFSPSSQ